MHRFNPASFFRIFVSLTLFTLTLTFLACSKGSVVEESISETAKTYRPPANPPAPVDGSVGNFPIQLLDGGASKIPELVGNKKVVLVNFWATWCGPCRREIPDLTALKTQFQGQDVEIIGLTVEEPELKDRVQSFARQFSINYTIGFSPMEVFGLFNRANGNDPRSPIPQTFIFDRNGKLVDSVKGLRRDFRTWAEGAIGYALKNS